MKQLGIIAICVLLLAGCKSTRKLAKNETERLSTESTETITTRIGDTVRFEIPKIRYRDTTITRTNLVTGTTQVLRYGSDGNITMAECISGAIEEITRSNKELWEQISDKQLESEKSIDPVIILYLFIGLALLVAVAIFVFMYQIGKQAKLVKGVIEKFT